MCVLVCVCVCKCVCLGESVYKCVCLGAVCECVFGCCIVYV